MLQIFEDAQTWIEKAQTGLDDFFVGCVLWSKLNRIATQRNHRTLEYSYDGLTKKKAETLAARVDTYLDSM